jgi:signal transduction histidine kinase
VCGHPERTAIPPEAGPPGVRGGYEAASRQITKTLGFRLTAWYSGLFIFSSTLLFAFAFYLVTSTIREYDHQMVQAKIDEYALMDRTDGLQALIHGLRLEEANNLESGFFIRLSDSSNKTLLLTIPHQWKSIDLSTLEEAPGPLPAEQWRSAIPKGRGGVFEVFSRRLSDGSILQVGKRPEKQKKLLESFTTIFAGILIPIVLIGITAGLFLAFRALRPIRDLIQTVRCIDDGKMDARVPSSQTGDELDELVQLFNRMLGRIETLITGMREALDNVAHDLRTPMTRLRGVIETALQSASGENSLREALMDSAEESERVLTALDTLMDISEAEQGIMNLSPAETDTAVLIRGVVELYQYVAEDKGVTVETSLPDKLYAWMDSNRMRQVLANLLDNAIKFTPAGGRVDVEASPGEAGVVILVRDTGIGIPAEDLPRIFDRLFRGEKSRSHRGLGLGLGMVQAVVRAHHGRIEVESRPALGTTFRVFLPGPATQAACSASRTS